MADEKLVMHEQRQKNNDRQWHTQQPQQRSATKSHLRLLFVALLFQRVGTRAGLDNHQQNDQAHRDTQ